MFANERNKLLYKGIKRISSDLDIFLMLDKIKEIDKLKRVIFNKDQQILFNFFPKQEISMVENNIVPSRIKT